MDTIRQGRPLGRRKEEGTGIWGCAGTKAYPGGICTGCPYAGICGTLPAGRKWPGARSACIGTMTCGGGGTLRGDRVDWADPLCDSESDRCPARCAWGAGSSGSCVAAAPTPCCCWCFMHARVTFDSVTGVFHHQLFTPYPLTIN